MHNARVAESPNRSDDTTSCRPRSLGWLGDQILVDSSRPPQRTFMPFPHLNHSTNLSKTGGGSCRERGRARTPSHHSMPTSTSTSSTTDLTSISTLPARRLLRFLLSTTVLLLISLCSRGTLYINRSTQLIHQIGSRFFYFGSYIQHSRPRPPRPPCLQPPPPPDGGRRRRRHRLSSTPAATTGADTH